MFLGFIVNFIPRILAKVFCFNLIMSSLLFSYAIFKVHILYFTLIKLEYGGDKEIRTLDPLLARQVLSQLSYTPTNVNE